MKCQDIMSEQNTDYNNNYCSKDIIWKGSCNYSRVFLVFGIALLSLPIYFLIFCFPYGALYSSPFLILSLLILNASKNPSIRFTNSELIVKNRDLRRKKHFLLSQIKEIQILIIMRKVYYYDGVYYAYSKSKFNILTLSGEYRYKFIWSFHESTNRPVIGLEEAKRLAIEKRVEFEKDLKNLEKYFPDLIYFQDLAPPEKSRSDWIDWIGIICLIGICILVGLSIFFWG